MENIQEYLKRIENSEKDYTDKYYEEWRGKQYPVRVVPVPEEWGFGSPLNIADCELWNAIHISARNGDKEAQMIDSEIFFYCDSGFIASEPTHAEIIKYLVEHGYAAY